MARLNVDKLQNQPGGGVAKATNLAAAQSSLAHLLSTQGNYDEAMSLYQHALSIQVLVVMYMNMK